MSSGYKIKGHQRSRSAKPYDRKAGLVNRVKEWLTPSSWLSNWSRDASGQAEAATSTHVNSQRLAGPLVMTGASSSSPRTSSAFVPRPGALANPFLSNPQALLGGSSSKAGLGPSGGTLDGVLPPPTASAVGGGIAGLSSASVASHSGSNMETRLRSLLAIPRSLRSGGGGGGMPFRLEAMEEKSREEDLDTSKDSEGSWIAEDDGSIKEKMEEESSKTEGQRSVRPRTNHLPPLNLSEMEERSEEYTYDLGEGHASVVQPTSQLTPVTKRAEQVILQVENPVAKPPPPHRTSSVDNGQTSLSSSILNRLYTTNPFAMSTPQLSPVHETREEESHGHDGGAKSPVASSDVSRSQFHTQSSMLTVAARDRSLPLSSMSTPSKLHAEESLRRSPFRSPFYSGRTSFGGAASGQKPRIKRPRTESSPPVFAPLRLSVMARPVSSSSKGGQLVASQTAKKIMESLGSLSSPLASARKLPMRALPGELQVAKRRRVSLDSEAAGTSSGVSGRVLSPPPIAPLRTPSHPSHANSGPLIVPNEKSAQSRRHETPSLRDKTKSNTGGIDFERDSRDGERSSIGKMTQPTDRGKDKTRGDSSSAPKETPPTIFSSLFPSSTSSFSSSASGSKPMFTVPNFSSTAPPKPSSILSGLTFSAPPCSVKPADGPDEQQHDRSPPGAADDDDTRNFSRGGGKMRTVRRSRRGAEQEENFEEDTGYINPMAPPPAVGLSLGKGGSLPKFIFHTQLAPTGKSQDSAPSFQSSSTTQATDLTSSSPAFSFSVPKSINSESAPTKTTGQPSKLEASFNFSTPKDHSPSTSLPPLAPNSSLLQGSFKPSPLLTFSTNSSPAAASLPRMSLFTNPSSNLSSFAKPVEKPKSTPPPPPLKNMSVEEALKKPEFQLPVTKTTVNIGSTVKQKAEVCIDLTDSDDEKETKEMSKSSMSSTLEASKAGSFSGGLQLGSSGGLKLGTAGGLKLGGAHGITGMTTAGKLGTAVTVGDSSGASTSLLITDSKSSAKPLTSLAQFAPPADSWACPQCLVTNQAKDDVCVACSAKKPSSKTDSKSSKVSLGSLSQFAAPPGAWECSQCMIRNKAEDGKCVACSSIKPSTLNSKTDVKIGSDSAPVFKPLSQFAPPSGSWECGQCLVNNKATDKTCVACSAARPSSAASSAVSQPVNLTSKETTKGLTLGGQLTAGGWSCDVCLVQNKATDTRCIACAAAKPGTMAGRTPLTSGGNCWTCNTCLVVNKDENTKCIACSALKPDNKPSSAPPPNFLSGFAPPTSSWTCDTCLVQNKPEDSSCVACTTPKPGSKPSETSGPKPAATSSLTVGSSGGLKLGGGLSLAGFKPLGGLVKGPQDASSASTTSSGGIKIGVSLTTALQPKNDKTTADSKANSGGGSTAAPVFGLPPASSGQSTIATLPEKNPLAGIKFGVSAPPSTTTAAASAQNPVGGIKFGIPSTTTTVTAPSTTAPSLQFGLGSTSTAALSSSPFKFGTLAAGSSDKQPVGLKLGGGGGESISSSMDTQMPGNGAAAPKLTVGLGQITTSQSLSSGTGLFGSGAQPSTASTAVNPLAGIKFGVPAPSQPSLLTSSAQSKTLQFPNQLQFGSTATSSAGSTSSGGLSFNFAATTSTATATSGLGGGSTASPFMFSGAKSSSTSGQPSIQFGVPTSTQQPGGGLNSVLNTSSTSEKPSSSLFVFSGGKDATKVGTSSPFTTAGSTSGSASGSAIGAMGGVSGLGGGASGLGGGASGLGGGASGLGGGAQPLKLNFGATQPSSNQPFQFGVNSGASGSIFGKPAEAAASQPSGLTLTGQQQPASGLTMPQSQGSIFGGASQPSQSQPQGTGFGQSFNFSGQTPSLAGGSGLGLGGASTNFPPSSGSLNFGAPLSQGVGLGGATQSSATQPAAHSQGFQFNPNAGIDFNFGGGGGPTATLGGGVFTAGKDSGSSNPSQRVIRKARRRK